MDKSELKKSIDKVFEEHELEDRDLRDDIVDRICQDFAGEVMDDEEESDDDSEGEEELELLGGGDED